MAADGKGEVRKGEVRKGEVRKVEEVRQGLRAIITVAEPIRLLCWTLTKSLTPVNPKLLLPLLVDWKLSGFNPEYWE